MITLNRPERMNSMAFHLMVPLHQAIETVAADNDTTCVILTGRGRGFCSGADTSNDGGVPPNVDGLTLTHIATRAMSLLADLVPAMQRMPKPVICAINGAAGRDLDAHEAAAIGLVSRVVPDDDLLTEALDLADQINGWSTQGTALTKRTMWAGLGIGSLRAAIEMESQTQLFVRLTTENFEEAVRARKEGRPPEFKD